jgi:hypothetical protein
LSRLIAPSSELLLLNRYLIYLILVMLNLKPFDYKIHLHNFSLRSTLILLSSINTISSTMSMYQWMSPYISFVNSSITILIENILNSSSHALTLVTIFVYISLIKVIYFVETFFFSSIHHMTFLDILPCTFFKLINIRYRSFLVLFISR